MTIPPNGSVGDSEDESNTPDADASRRSRGGRRAVAVGIVVLVIIALWAPYWLSRKVPYYALGPGPTESVENIIQIKNGPKIPHKGQMYFTTVNESNGRIYRLQYLMYKWFNHDYALERAHDIELPPQVTCSTPNEFAVQTMSDSQKTALSVALRRLHLPVTVKYPYFRVAGVVKGSAAEGKLQSCDILESINGQAITDGNQPHQIISAMKPGDLVNLVVKGVDGKERNVAVNLGQNKGQAFLGVAADGSGLQVTTDEPVSFAKTDVGGPSAGLAFTLGLIDDLTPGNLTGGKPVAATGEIDVEGKVQPIGGIAQKTKSVYRQGIRLFLVPQENYKEAKKAAPKGLVVVPVATLDDALRVLGEHGGDVASLPPAVDLSKN